MIDIFWVVGACMIQWWTLGFVGCTCMCLLLSCTDHCGEVGGLVETSDLELIIATFEHPCTWDLPVMDDLYG